MGVILSAMATDRRRDIDRMAEEMQAAIKSVNRRARGMSTTDAQVCLEDALRARGLHMPDSVTGHIARHLADPWWSVKHPVAAWKEFREMRLEDSGGVEAITGDPELDELSSRLDKVDQVRGIFGPVGADRVYVVTINPWSGRVARRVRALAAPVDVDVQPFS
jgi:hypothetical protein